MRWFIFLILILGSPLAYSRPAYQDFPTILNEQYPGSSTEAGVSNSIQSPVDPHIEAAKTFLSFVDW